MAEKITTHLHLSCHLLTVELFSCFMMAAILDKSALTGNRMNFVKNCCSIFKTSPATCADYLQGNDLHELHQARSTDYLFFLKLWSLCEHVQTKGDRGWGFQKRTLLCNMIIEWPPTVYTKTILPFECSIITFLLKRYLINY